MDKTLAVLKAVKKLTKGDSNIYVPTDQILARVRLSSGALISHLDAQGYLMHIWKNGDQAFTLAPKGFEYISNANNTLQSKLFSLFGLIFAFIAAIPVFPSILQWLLRLLSR